MPLEYFSHFLTKRNVYGQNSNKIMTNCQFSDCQLRETDFKISSLKTVNERIFTLSRKGKHFLELLAVFLIFECHR